jgi:hypothetical protein
MEEDGPDEDAGPDPELEDDLWDLVRETAKPVTTPMTISTSNTIPPIIYIL